MKTKKCIWSLLLVICCLTSSAMASGLGDIRINARFLTDRMAFELNLTQTQYNDLYEVNYDFFHCVDPYVAAMARSESYALDAYYRYLDERNDDLRWILSSAEYVRFMALDYFFRPVYAMNNICYLRVYKMYPNRTFFYFDRPAHYLTYCGAHSRHHCGGRSFYQKRYPRVYHHAIYRGDFRCRPDNRKHDFMARRPSSGSGYHFTPAHRPPHPAMSPEKPHRPAHRPDIRPSHPAKPHPRHPNVKPSRTDKPGKHPIAKPAHPNRKPQARPRPERPERNVSKERGNRLLHRT